MKVKIPILIIILLSLPSLTEAELKILNSYTRVAVVSDITSNNLTPSSVPATFPTRLDYTILSSQFIPCITNTVINSEIPGKVIMTVTGDIFGFHGSNILIPRGSIVEGISSGSNLAFGDTRLSVSVQRITTPEGIFIYTDSLLHDGVGRTGVTGEVNSRILELILYPIATRALIDISSATTNRISSQIGYDGLTDSTADRERIVSAIVDKYINTSPVIEVPARASVTVLFKNDIVFALTDGQRTFNKIIPVNINSNPNP